jgi:hypothetical protein
MEENVAVNAEPVLNNGKKPAITSDKWKQSISFLTMRMKPDTNKIWRNLMLPVFGKSKEKRKDAKLDREMSEVLHSLKDNGANTTTRSTLNKLLKKYVRPAAPGKDPLFPPLPP